MSFEAHITKMDERPVPKLWLAKPDFTIIERINGVSNLSAKMNYMNENEISFDVNSHLFDEFTNEQYRNPTIEKMRNKYLIKMTYNKQTEWFIIENFSKTSDDKDYVPTTAKYIGSELDKKWVGDIEEIGVTPAQLFNKFLPVIAPNWSVRSIDEKVAKIKREYTTSDASVSTLIEEVCKATDAVVVFHNRDRQFSLVHRDNAGKFKGLKVKEATYLKGFTDEQNSENLTTRLVLFGKDGLTINGVNPAGTDYIEDFSYYMKPFRRDSRRNVLEHSDYMSDALCHALLDFEEYFNNKTDDYEKLSEQYTNLLKEQLEEEFKLTEITAIKQRLEDRVELLKPQGNYTEKRILGNTSFDFKYNTRYIMVIKNNGTTARLTLNGEEQIVAGGQSTYFKIHTPPQATLDDPQIRHTLQVLSATPNLMASLSTASEDDFAEQDILEIEKKFNIYKYRELYTYQVGILAAVERRIKEYDNQRQSINNSLAVDTFFPPALVKERENFINWGVWREEDHTDAKELLEDGLKQLKEHNNVERTVTVSLIDFIQSLEDKENWDKLSAGDKIQFSNKIYDANMEAFISELNINFDNHDVSVTLSNIIDLKDRNRGIAQKMASFVSTAGQVNMQKSQLEDQLHKSNQVIALLEGEWDANKRRITAANETVSIDNRGIIITSPSHPNEMLVAVAGVIAISNDGGETFKQAINTRGVVAERLIGKVLIGTELVMENNAGTFRFDNEGVRINASNFHLIADDGEDYFDTLMRRLQQEIVTAEEKISEEIKQQGESLKSEINDVDQSLMDYTAGLINALADGLLTEQEIHSLKLQLNMLEADYSQVARRVKPILFDSALDPVIQEELYVSYYKLDDDYQILVSFIRSLEEPTEVPQETINNILALLKRFKPAIEELVAMIETALTNTQKNRIANAEYNSNTFAENLANDLNNEISDLNDSLKGLNDSLEDALSDGIITTVEKSQLSDALMRFESEKQDVDNRFHNTYNHPHIIGTTNRTSLQQAKNDYNNAYSRLIAKVKQILNMSSVSHAIVEEYKALYQEFTTAVVAYSEEYERAVEFIQKGYADTAEGEAKKYTDGLRMEVEADVKDIHDNIVEFETDVYGAFKDGIITEQERNRLGIHHDMLEKEKSDLIERYDTIITSDYLQGFYDVEQLVTTRSLYGQVHADLLLALELAMMDSKITKEESQEATRLFALYVQRLTQFSKELELAIAALGESKAVAHTNEQLNNYMSLSVFNDEIAMLQAEIDGHIMTWYYDHEPTLSSLPASEWKDDKTRNAHVGDLFYHETEGHAFRFMRKSGGGYEWQLIKDTEVTKALSDAQNALDLADDKRRVFVTQPTPPYDIGDLWIKGDGELMRARVNKEGKTQFSELDWIKATKYTDDTVANQVGNQLNEYKQSNNQEIQDLRETLGAFRNTVEGAFKDGIIAEYELKILKTQMQSLDREKADVDAGYNKLLNHPSLTGAPKTRLQTAYTNFSETHNNLTSTINQVISDGVITEAEYESAMSLLDNYPITLTNYKNVMNETYLHLIQLVENLANNALDVAGRFDTWKSSSFEVDVDKIATRVGESSWEEKYLPIVNENISNIGSENLIPYSHIVNYIDQWDTVEQGTERRTVLTAPNSGNAAYDKTARIYSSTVLAEQYFGVRSKPLVKNIIEGETYTLSFKTTNHASSYTDMRYTFLMREASGGNQGLSTIIKTTETTRADGILAYHHIATFQANFSGKASIMIATRSTSNIAAQFHLYEPMFVQGKSVPQWTSSPNDQIQDFYNTEIKSNYSTTKQTKELLGSYVTSTEMQGNLDKVATGYGEYDVSQTEWASLREVSGSTFDDAFSYEVTASRATSDDTLFVAVFNSRGRGKGWEREILEQKGSISWHPEVYNTAGGDIRIRTYGTPAKYKMQVVYTKYAGSFTNLSKTNSMIEQKADSITSMVKNRVSGGKNLMPYSNIPDDLSKWGTLYSQGGTSLTTGVSGTAYGDFMWVITDATTTSTSIVTSSPRFHVKEGTTLTISFIGTRFLNTYDDMRYMAWIPTGTNQSISVPDKVEIGKISGTQSVYHYQVTTTPNFTGEAYIIFGTRLIDTSKTGRFYIKDVMVEEGTVASGWTPSLADTEERWSKIEQTQENISSEVGKKVGNNEIISKINQSAEKVSIDADKISLTAGSSIDLAIQNTAHPNPNLIPMSNFWSYPSEDFYHNHALSNVNTSQSGLFTTPTFGRGWVKLMNSTLAGDLTYMWTQNGGRNRFSITSGQTYTFSILVAQNYHGNDLNYCWIRDVSTGSNLQLNLATSSAVTRTKLRVGNTYNRPVYKYIFTFTPTFGGNNTYMFFGMNNGVEGRAGYYLSEWKLEAGDQASPYNENYASKDHIISAINADRSGVKISGDMVSITAKDVVIDGKTINIGSNPAITGLKTDVGNAQGTATSALSDASAAQSQADAARVGNNVVDSINSAATTVDINGDRVNINATQINIGRTSNIKVSTELANARDGDKIAEAVNAAKTMTNINGDRINLNGTAYFNSAFGSNRGITAISGGKIRTDEMTARRVNIVTTSGREVMSDGYDRSNRAVSKMTPHSMSNNARIGASGSSRQYIITESSSFIRADAFVFSHTARYLMVNITLNTLSSAPAIRARLRWRKGSSDIFSGQARETRDNIQDEGLNYDKVLILDMGEPLDYGAKQMVYVDFRTEGAASATGGIRVGSVELTDFPPAEVL